MSDGASVAAELGLLATSDEELVAAVRRGDDRAFEQLYGRYQRRISAYVMGMVRDHGRTEDVTQEVFVSALRRMRSTDRPIVFKPWIYEIARNACIDQYRRQRRHGEVLYDGEEPGGESGGPEMADDGGSPHAALEAKERFEHLRGALGGLSEAHHQILVMREFEGLSYDEIGRRLGLTRASVESTLFRARKRLLEEHEELVSGRRCRAVQTLIEAGDVAELGRRNLRTLDRHLSHCQPCRRTAALAGFRRVPERRRLVEKVAAFLPLPAVLRRWLGGGGAPGGVRGPGAAVSNWVASAGSSLDAASGWAKAGVAAVLVAAAGAGAGVATQSGGSAPAHHGAAARHVASPAGSPHVRSARPVQVARGTLRRARTHRAARTVAPRHSLAVAQRTPVTSSPTVTRGGSSTGSAGAGSGHAPAAPAVTAPHLPTPSVPATAPSVPAPTTGSVTGAVDGAANQAGQVVQGATQAVQGTVQGATQTVSGVTSKVTGAVQNTAGQLPLGG